MKKENIITLGLLGLTLTLIVKNRKSKKSLGIGVINNPIYKLVEEKNKGIKQFINNTLTQDTGSTQKYEIYIYEKRLKEISKEVGFDVKRVIIISDEIRHIRNRHLGTNEKSKNNIPLVFEDLCRIPFLLNFGMIYPNTSSKNPLAKELIFWESVTREKNYGELTLVGLEVTWSKEQNSMYVKTLYIRKK